MTKTRRYMFKVRVTTLEAYRKYLHEANEYETEESVINTIKGVFTGSPCYARIGTAFHQIVELGSETVRPLADGRYEVTLTEKDEYTKIYFNKEQVMTALKYKMSFPCAFHEVELGAEFQTKHFPIWVEGHCDMLHGTFIRDIKTKYSPIRYFDYANSAQWRLYLELTGLDTFYFDFFEFKGYKPDIHGYDVSGLDMTNPYEIECIRYDSMWNDNHNLVSDFADFVVNHDLTQYLKTR